MYKNHSKKSVLVSTILLCSLLTSALEGSHVSEQSSKLYRLAEGAEYYWKRYGRQSVIAYLRFFDKVANKTGICVEALVDKVHTTAITNSTYNSLTTRPFFVEMLMDAIRSQDCSKVSWTIFYAPGLLDKRDKNGDSPLNLAAMTKSPENSSTLKAILNQLFLTPQARTKLVNQKSGPLDNTPLISAATKGNKSDVYALINSYEANVDATNKLGETALLKALQGRHSKIVFNLILPSHGASVQKSLIKAYKQKDFETLEYALHLKHKNGNLALAFATTLKALKTMLKLSKNVDLRTPLHPQDDLILTSNANQETLLHWAVMLDSYPMVKYLLKNGLIKWVNFKNATGETPLFYLQPFAGRPTKKADLKIAKLLIENGANIEERNTTGTTVTMTLIKNVERRIEKKEDFKHALSVIDFFISKGAHINTEDNSGSTAIADLHLTYPFSKELISYLAKQGGDLNHKSFPFGMTPLWRSIYDNPNMTPLLINLGASWMGEDNKSLCENILQWPDQEGWGGSDDTREQTIKAIVQQFTGQNDITLPFKQGFSREILSGFLKALHYSRVDRDTLEYVCLIFVVSLSTDKGLTLSQRETEICLHYFTTTPAEFRATFFSQKKQHSAFNNVMKKQCKALSLYNITKPNKKLFQDITIVSK